LCSITVTQPITQPRRELRKCYERPDTTSDRNMPSHTRTHTYMHTHTHTHTHTYAYTNTHIHTHTHT
jgi:hypothetical protein